MCLRITAPPSAALAAADVRPCRTARAETLLEAPVDRPTELRQRVVHVDDLVEPRFEEIILPAVQPLLGPASNRLRQADGETESTPPNAPINFGKKSSSTAAASLQMQ